MNELKPDDVMRALEVMSASGVYASPNFQMNILALLREKDERIAELEAENQEVHSNWQKLKKSFDEVSEEDKRILAQKDAEIERLNNAMDAMVVEHTRLIEMKRTDAITEFAEEAKKRLPIISPSVFDKIAKKLKGEIDGDS